MNQDARATSWELAVASARFAAGLDDGTHVGALATAVVDWPEAIETARDQAVLAWLAKALTGRGPPGAAAMVHAATVGDAARALAQVRLLGTITQAFNEAAIPVLPYKGPALSLQLYGDAALRRSTDLDLVVAKADYARARAVLGALGLPSRRGHSAHQERALFSWLGHASFGRGRDDFVELHWRFAPIQFAFALDPESAMSRSSIAMVGRTRMRRMATDDLLVTLAMHGARHLYERLEWLSGVVRLLRTTSSPPSALAQHASTLHARRMLLSSVVVANRVLEFPISDAWNVELQRDRGAIIAGEEIARQVVDHGVSGAPFATGLTLQLLYGRLADSWWDRLRALVRAALMPTERESEAVRLPDQLTPFYYIVRPVRLIAQYVRRSLARDAVPERPGA